MEERFSRAMDSYNQIIMDSICLMSLSKTYYFNILKDRLVGLASNRWEYTIVDAIQKGKILGSIPLSLTLIVDSTLKTSLIHMMVLMS